MFKQNLRDAFSAGLVEAAEMDERIVVLDPDVARSTKMLKFKERFPENFFEFGVAEQNMMGASVGFAREGFIPFCVAFAPFSVLRPLEITRTSIAYPGLNVKIVGLYAGVSCAKEGATHMTFEDVGAMRSIPGMCVITACDPVMAKAVAHAAAEDNGGPIFIRLDSEELPCIYPEGSKYEIGKAYVLREGSDVTLVGYGSAVHRLLKAADILAETGISAEVIDAATVKPLDRDTIMASAGKTGHIVSLEDHNIYGGLSSALSEILAKEIEKVIYTPVAIMDVFGISGTIQQEQEELHLTAEDVVNAAKNMLNR